jgi:hypothetical protein
MGLKIPLRQNVCKKLQRICKVRALLILYMKNPFKTDKANESNQSLPENAIKWAVLFR